MELVKETNPVTGERFTFFEINSLSCTIRLDGADDCRMSPRSEFFATIGLARRCLAIHLFHRERQTVSPLQHKPSQRRGASLVRDEADRQAVQKWLALHHVEGLEFQLQDFNHLIADINAGSFDWIVVGSATVMVPPDTFLSLLKALWKSDTELWAADGDWIVSDKLLPILADLDQVILDFQSLVPLLLTDEQSPQEMMLQELLALAKQLVESKRSEERAKKLESLNPTQRKLYDATPEKGPLTGEEISANAGVGFNSNTKNHLALLVKMELLRTEPGGGYLRPA